MDIIEIKGLELFAYHGVNPEEKEDGQHFLLDITLTADLTRARQTDELSDTVSYAAVKKTAEHVFTAAKYDLIERAAQVVCEAILREHEKVLCVKLRLKKPEAPMKGKFDYAAVTVTEKRENHAGSRFGSWQ